MARKMADCRRFDNEFGCTLTIIGEEDEVVRTAAEHAVSVHGHEDSAALRDQIRGLLETEDGYVPGTRQAEPFPA